MPEQAAWSIIPPERLKKITSSSLLDLVMATPIIIPNVFMRLRVSSRIRISLVEEPLLARVEPREITSTAL